MSTHNICFYGELEKIIPELSSNTPPYQVPCIFFLFRLNCLNIINTYIITNIYKTQLF